MEERERRGDSRGLDAGEAENGDEIGDVGCDNDMYVDMTLDRGEIAPELPGVLLRGILLREREVGPVA